MFPLFFMFSFDFQFFCEFFCIFSFLLTSAFEQKGLYAVHTCLAQSFVVVGNQIKTTRLVSDVKSGYGKSLPHYFVSKMLQVVSNSLF